MEASEQDAKGADGVRDLVDKAFFSFSNPMDALGSGIITAHADPSTTAEAAAARIEEFRKATVNAYEREYGVSTRINVQKRESGPSLSEGYILSDAEAEECRSFVSYGFPLNLKMQ